jgi:hypothetical protein
VLWDLNGDFEGGYYLGKINFPKNYPVVSPQITLLTESGKFEVDQQFELDNNEGKLLTAFQIMSEFIWFFESGAVKESDK